MCEKMRIGGLVSGMDTEQIVKDLMRAERMPMDKLAQQKQSIEWQRDQYRELNTIMAKFRDNIFDTVMRSAKMSAKSVTSSNSNLVTATASAAASNSSFNISSVKQLATAANSISNRSLTADGSDVKIDPTKNLHSQPFEGTVDWKQGVIEKENISVSEANNTFTLENTNMVTDVPAEKAISVKVNGELYEVVTDPIADGQVKIDTTTGELTFFETIAKGSTISATYVNDTKTNTLSASSESPKKEFSLGAGALVSADLSINVDGTEYTVANGGIATDKDSFDAGTGDVYVDLETGNIEFRNEVSTDVNVTYAQHYMSSTMTTHNSDGEVKDQFFIAGDKSLDQALKQVNESNVDVSVFYDEFSDRVTMMRGDTGKFNETGEEIKFSGSFFTDALRLSHLEQSNVGDKLVIKDNSGIEKTYQIFDQDGNDVTATATDTFLNGSFQDHTVVVDGKTVGETDVDGTFTFLGTQNAQNAQFTINGLETERQSNQFTMSGVTFTLKDTFETGSVNLNVNTDTDSVFDTVVGFIDEYNKMLETVNGKLTEEHYRDFKPLTDEQKEAMSEKDIEAWEEKATSGLLRRDSTLSGGMDRLRTDIYNPVSGNSDNANVRQLTDLGITTSKNYLDRGKLEINEDKLRAAIETDPEGVFQLFAADGPTTADKGIARRMRDSLQNTMQSVSERAGGSFGKIQNHQFTLGRNIADIDSRISNFERRLEQVEDRYWKQFTAMETAMQQANEQSANLMSMLNGGNQQQ